MNWSQSDLDERNARVFGQPKETPAVGAGKAPAAPEAPARTVRIPRGPNRWETAYAREELEPRRLTGEILWYGFEALKIRLADGAHYTPDFAVVGKDGTLRFVEIKGFAREAYRVRVKVAAEVTPFPICVVTRENGAWVEEWFPKR